MQETISPQLAATAGVSSDAVLESRLQRGIPDHCPSHSFNAGGNMLQTILSTKQQRNALRKLDCHRHRGGVTQTP